MRSDPTCGDRWHPRNILRRRQDGGSAGHENRIPLAYPLFFRESLKSLGSTASVVPSSRFLSAALLEPLDFRSVRTVVELGCGTGAVTHHLLKRLPSHARVFALDTNESFIRHLRQNCKDERLATVHSGAQDLVQVLSRFSIEHVDAIVSSLGLTSMDPSVRLRILRQICHTLAPGGILTQYQYLFSLGGPFARFRLPGFHERRFLGLFFREVEARHVLWNLPPATVFACRK